MSVQISTFPDKIEVRLTSKPTYGWDVVIDLGDGNHLFLTDELADRLSADLWNRSIKQAGAA